MGALIDQPIRSLFQGVSRQPDSVRLPGQVEDSDNALCSVVSGGFEKRMPLEHVSALAGAPSGSVASHMWSRDTEEGYYLEIDAGFLYIWDIATGAAQTVTYDGLAQSDVGVNPTAIRAYLTNASDPKGFVFATIVDSTLIVNKSVTVAMASDGVFDNTTLPIELKRLANGDFNVVLATYNSRPSGTSITNPDPAFVGSTISDIAYWKDRVGFSADETETLSQAGDYFNFWIQDFANVVDSDPIKRVAGASTNTVNLIRHTVPFRSALFVTADKAQFELSAGGSTVLSPSAAAMDLATSYDIDAAVRPLVLGDSLFFVAKAGGRSTLFEYYYDEDSSSNTADDAAKHVQGYLPAPVTRLAGDTVTGTMVLQTSAELNTLYVYRYFWDGDTKAQSAWGRWIFPALTEILYADFIDGWLQVVGRLSDGTTHLHRMSVEAQAGPLNHEYAILLDCRDLLTGTYDAGTGLTSWTLPYPHDSKAQALLSSEFPTGQIGRVLNVSYSGANVITAKGDFSGGQVIVGLPYRWRVKLSKQYVRENTDGKTGSTITSGRLQLRNMTFDYEDTAYFEVHVTPEARATRIYKFTSRILGSALPINSGGLPLSPDGSFSARIRSRGDTVGIELISDAPVPARITSARWVGFFNELTRQE